MSISEDTSFVETMPRNVALQLLDRIERTPQGEAFRFPQGEEWGSITWREAGDRIARFAAGLLSLGLSSEQRVGIASSTRYEWILADLAVMCAGGATTTVYPTTHADDVAYIVGDSECRVIFAEDDEQIAKLTAHRGDLPHLEKVVTFDGASDGDWVIGLEDLGRLGDAYLAEHPDAIREVADSIDGDQLATLIYTSGTTGRPKGVRLLHRSWVFQGEAIRAQGTLDDSDLQYLWLPMAHSFGKVLLCTQLACGFATAVDGRVDKIIANLAVVKPTFMGAAPRIFEKAHGRIVTMTEAEGGAKEKLFKRAFAVGLEVDRRTREGKSVPLALKAQHALFDKLVFSKVRERFGGRVRFFISGSAALNQEIAEWFHAAGILILEGYGLTENAAGATVNRPHDYRMGSVGQTVPGGEISIGADDEVLVRGPHVMDGYHNMPEETARTLDAEGWLHTGDKGQLDERGFLTITGRIKDLFKTSGGKYIAPAGIDSKFKAICPYVSQFLVYGNERNYCVALVALDGEAMQAWATENGKGDASFAEVVSSPEVEKMIAGHVEELNSRLNRWETIKKWRILDHELTIESGEITPSMKVKRNVVEDNHAQLIDELYAS